MASVIGVAEPQATQQHLENNKLCFYIAGLLVVRTEVCTYSAKQWRYEIKFASKTNTNIIGLLEQVFIGAGVY